MLMGMELSLGARNNPQEVTLLEKRLSLAPIFINYQRASALETEPQMTFTSSPIMFLNPKLLE